MKIDKYPGVEIRLIHAPAGLPQRYTQMEVNINGTQYVEGAICGPNDQFSRKYGRQLAARRMFDYLKDCGIPEDLRKEILFRVCPEFKN